MRRSFGLVVAALLVLAMSPPALAEGDVDRGRKLSETHCSRCHVVGDFNKFGGLGSTPSFQLLAGLADGRERFETFFERRPHPAFVRVPGVERWSKAPAYAKEFTVTRQAIDDVLAFVATLEKRDLRGIPVGRAERLRRGQFQ